MPQMANITVKNSALADVVYSAMTPSAGDRVPARWRQEAAHAFAGYRPVLEITSRANGKSNARRIDLTLSYPTVGGPADTPVITARPYATVSVLVPTNVPATQTDEFVTQFVNLLGANLVREVLKAGYAPT